MDEIKRVQMCLHLLLVLSLFPVLAVKYSYIIRRAGAEVTMPCEALGDGGCGAARWLYSPSEKIRAVVLFDGQNQTGTSRSGADRLRVADCSLVVSKVTVEDAGQYTCRKVDQATLALNDSQVYLTVVNVSRSPPAKSGEVTFKCSVSTYGPCSDIKLLFVNPGGAQNNMEASGCSATVSFSQSVQHSLVQCKVSDGYKEKTFGFIPPSPEPGNNGKTRPLGDWWWPVALFVGFATTVILVGIFFRWRRNKANRTKTDEDAVGEKAEDVAYASLSHSSSSSSAVQIRGGGNAVIYSTVKDSSSSPGPR